MRKRRSRLSPEDAAVLSMMADYPLEPGQMLLLGPRSVAILTGGEEFRGKLPDKHVLERKEWAGE